MQRPEILKRAVRHRWASDKVSHRQINQRRKQPPEVRHRWASDKASHRHSNHQQQLLKTLERITFHWMTGDKDSHPVLNEGAIKIQLNFV